MPTQEPTQLTKPKTKHEKALEKQLIKKLAKIMGSLDKFEKTGKNSSQGYSFVEQSVVVANLRPKLAEANIMILPEITEQKVERYTYTNSSGRETNGVQALLKTKYTVIDGDTGESIELEWAGEANDTSDKATNKAATASNKYFLMKLFNISDKDDTDHDSTPAPASNEPSDKQKILLRNLLSDKGYTGDTMRELSNQIIQKDVPTTRKDFSDMIDYLMNNKKEVK